jgi:hypothetical protein
MIAKPVATAGTWGHTKASAPAPIVEINSGQSRFTNVRPGWTSGNDDCVRALASTEAIGDEVSARRPSHAPATPAIAHQAAETGTSKSSEDPLAPATVTAASAVAAAALRRTVVLRKSVKRI